MFTNNIVSYNLYGVFGDYGVGLGMLAINAYFPGSSFARNAIVGGTASNFPADNYYPSPLAAVGFADLANRNYALAPGTPYVRAGTDGKDVGADFTAMAAAMAAASSPAPASAIEHAVGLFRRLHVTVGSGSGAKHRGSADRRLDEPRERHGERQFRDQDV